MIFDVIYSILKVSIAFGQVSPQEMLDKALAFPNHTLIKDFLDAYESNPSGYFGLVLIILR